MLKRATKGSAGYDLAVNQDYLFLPGEILKMSTGIQGCVPDGMVGLIRERSSIGDRGLHVLAGVIDSDYRGEIKIILKNGSEVTQVIRRGDRVANMILLPFGVLPNEPTEHFQERGTGGFGSTGA